MDLGGTKLALSLAEVPARDRARLIAHRRRPTSATGNPRADVDAIVRDVRSLLAEAGRSLDDIDYVGLSVPGPFDTERGTLLKPPNLPGWDEVPIRDWITAALGRPVRIDNDANAAALAEWRFGAGQGAHHLVYLTMSTGVGAGLVLDGKLYRGWRGNAGEFGHVTVEPDGEPCACGLSGCLESYVGGAAWTRRLRKACPPSSQVAALAGGREHATPEHVVAAAQRGDAFALAEFQRFNSYLARGIATVVFALAPQVIVLGTIPTAAGEHLCLEPLREQVAAMLWPEFSDGLRIVASGLGDDLAYYAGICVALEAPG
ncbi:MAG: ROK family protein [Myxococcota bacterium]